MISSHKAVSSLYDGICGYYELVNSFLTFGLDIYWRKSAASKISHLPLKNPKILDVCCGTGDFALDLNKKFKSKAEITASDLNESMLQKAQKRLPQAKVILADSFNLPFENDSFDLLTISFATRNLNADKKDFPNALKEFHRVLKHGGYFANLETTKPTNPILKFLMSFYVKFSIGILNFLNPSSKNSYNFLKTTILNFYEAKEFSSLLKEAGFSDVKIKIFCPGAVALHICIKN